MGFKTLATVIFIALAALGVFYVNDNLLVQNKNIKPKSFLDEFNRPIFLSHRGSRYLGPENTLHMHKVALDIGTDVMEFDVRLTKDNQLVIFHDSTVDRTTNAVGLVKDFTLEELRTLDLGFRYTPNLNVNSTSLKHNDREMDEHEKKVFDPNTYIDENDGGIDLKKNYPYRGLSIKISTLDEFLDTFSEQFKNIEIKDEDNLAAELLWKAIEKRGQVAKTVVISRFCNVLSHFRNVSNNKVATAACEGEVVSVVIAAKAHVSNILFTWFKTIPPARVLQVPTESGGLILDTPDVIDGIHKLGLKVHYWVVNDAKAMRLLLERGADGIITDRIDLAVQVANEMGIIHKPSKIAPSEVNSTKSYFIPTLNPQEIHHCISALCLFFQNFQYIAAALFIVVLYLSARKSTYESTPRIKRVAKK